MATSGQRGGFNSKLGFILAAAGSAIGLGNIWRFPYSAGENGGAAFILVYLVAVVFICMPVLFAELAIGRATQKSPVGAFEQLAPKSGWKFVGGLGVLTGFAILAFYAVIAGWTIGYVGKAVMGEFSNMASSEAAEAVFTALSGSPWYSTALTALFLALTALVVRGGVQGGIERAAKVLMPIFLVLLVGLCIRSVTLPGASEGLSFLFKVDFSKITLPVVVSALGQALFSMSLGMGAMITYGSYVSRKERLPGAAVGVGLADTVIAMLAGLMVFPALFAAGGSPDAGPGLVFIAMPSIFHSLPAGSVIAVFFYMLLAIAALTSTISLLEVVVAYFVDQWNWSRRMATWGVTFACFLLAIPSALSGDFLGFQSVLFGNYALSIGALLICLFVGWRWGVAAAVAEIYHGLETRPLGGVWSALVRYVCPVVILGLIVAIILNSVFGLGMTF